MCDLKVKPLLLTVPGPSCSRPVAAGTGGRAAGHRFTPCTVMNLLLETVNQAAQNVVSPRWRAGAACPGDAVLFSPAASSFDQVRNYQHRADVFRQAVARGGNVVRVADQSGTS